MVWLKLAKFAAIGLGGLILLSVVLSIVLGVLGTILGITGAIVGMGFAVFGMLMALLVPIASLAVLGALIYGVYVLVSDGSDERAEVDLAGAYRSEHTGRTDRADADRQDPVERVKSQYAAGEIDERELELALERELDRDSSRSVELERE